jgi:hypothetical protein
VRWRPDYASARKEATATGKPLLLDFGTEACIWCRKLDATTFRDRGVVALLNERFVPVKVDGNQDARLTQAAGVQAFPTIVLVSAEGKIIGRHDGYADVAKMIALLRQAAPQPAVAAISAPAPSGVVPAGNFHRRLHQRSIAPGSRVEDQAPATARAKQQRVGVLSFIVFQVEKPLTWNGFRDASRGILLLGSLLA